jgi:hypothetical protein
MGLYEAQSGACLGPVRRRLFALRSFGTPTSSLEPLCFSVHNNIGGIHLLNLHFPFIKTSFSFNVSAMLEMEDSLSVYLMQRKPG